MTAGGTPAKALRRSVGFVPREEDAAGNPLYAA